MKTTERIIAFAMLLCFLGCGIAVTVLIWANQGNRELIALLGYENGVMHKHIKDLVELQDALQLNQFTNLHQWGTVLNTIGYEPKSITFVGTNRLRTFNLGFPLESTDGFIGSQTFYWLLDEPKKGN